MKPGFALAFLTVAAGLYGLAWREFPESPTLLPSLGVFSALTIALVANDNASRGEGTSIEIVFSDYRAQFGNGLAGVAVTTIALLVVLFCCRGLPGGPPEARRSSAGTPATSATPTGSPTQAAATVPESS